MVTPLEVRMQDKVDAQGEYPKLRYIIVDALTGQLVPLKGLNEKGQPAPASGKFEDFGEASLAAFRLWTGRPLHVVALPSSGMGRRIARLIERGEAAAKL